MLSPSSKFKFNADNSITSLTWSPDGSRIALATQAGLYHIITREGRSIWKSEQLFPKTFRLIWTEDGKQIIGISQEGIIWLIDANSQRYAYNIPIGTSLADGVEVNGSDELILLSHDGRLFSCNLTSSKITIKKK